SDVAAVTQQHINVSLHRPDMDFAVVGFFSYCFADVRRTGSWNEFPLRGSLGRSWVFEFIHKFGIHRLRSAESCQQGHLETFGVLSEIRILPEEIMRHLIISPSDDLFAIITSVQPRVGIPRAPNQFGSPDQRLRQIDGVRHNERKCDAIAMPDVMLDNGCLIALHQAIAAYPGPFEMCCVDSENLAVVLARRESHPGVLRPRRRMRSAIHPNRAVPFRDLTPHPDRDEPLGVRIAFFPKSEIASPVQQKFRSVGGALLL